MSLAPAWFAAIRAAPLSRQRFVHLLLDDTLLDGFQNQLAFRKGEAKGFQLHSLPLPPGYFLHLLLSGIAYGDELEAECHARPPLI